MKRLILAIEENDGSSVSRAEKSIGWRELERMSVKDRWAILEQVVWELNRDLEKKLQKPVDKTQCRD